MYRLRLRVLLCLPLVVIPLFGRQDSGPPNIVIILADDMGYGDVHALNPQSRIPTPSLDRVAGEGMSFVDGHSPSAVCTPTRYGLLTGRYAWRTRLKSGVLGGYSRPLLEPGRVTIAGLLKRAGYQTAAVGKWHLGMELPLKADAAFDDSWEGDPGVDFSRPITDSPIQHGFDSFFGVAASLDMPPYVFIRNSRFDSVPDLEQEAVPFPHYIRPGPRARDFIVDEVLDRLKDEAARIIEHAGSNPKPLFLYVALTAPHKPTQPQTRFRGRTALGEYGDFISQVDWTVGAIVDSIDRAGMRDNTLVFFTSDNGSYMYAFDESEAVDHVDDPAKQGYYSRNHRANGPFRGTKADIWEGGHHVPLLVRWPGQVPTGSSCRSTVALVDLFATCAEIAGAEIEEGVAQDSCSLLRMMRGEAAERPVPVIHHSIDGMFSIRDGKWKLVLGNGSGGREAPAGEPFQKPYQLYDLSRDLGETRDLASQNPDVVARLTARFETIRGRD